jgi:hypothetical protein
MRYRQISIVSTLFIALAVSGAEPPVRAQLDPSISIAHCLDTIDLPNSRNEARCPGFLAEPLKEARQICADAGGTLTATPSTDIWKLDVDGDAIPEFIFEYAGNVQCEGAWSVFDCGSLGCSKALYQKHRGAWRMIAAISADSPQTLELTDVAAAHGYRDLRVGCEGDDPCPVYSYYHWDGGQYEPTHLEVRGHRVEFGNSIHGLYGLTGAIDVFTEPTKGAATAGHYAADTIVAIVGTATGLDYYYVSPCNACDSGFIPKSSVRPLQP